jgi:phosphoglycolate phosphatase-like HAD superfamily hydrolase
MTKLVLRRHRLGRELRLSRRPCGIAEPTGLGVVTLRLHLQARRFRRADPRKFDLSRYFLAVYADTAGSLHHTKTALLRHPLEEQSLDVATTFMVGDRNFDIEAARANGVTPISSFTRKGILGTKG